MGDGYQQLSRCRVHRNGGRGRDVRLWPWSAHRCIVVHSGGGKGRSHPARWELPCSLQHRRAVAVPRTVTVGSMRDLGCDCVRLDLSVA